MTPDQASSQTPLQPKSLAALPQRREAPCEEQFDGSMAVRADAPRLRLIASEEQRAHQAAAQMQALLDATRQVTIPLAAAADGIRGGLQKFIQGNLHTLHARRQGGGFGFNQQAEERISIKPLMKLCETATKKLDRHIGVIDPSNQIALMVRGRTVGLQSSVERFALLMHDQADEAGTVSKSGLRNVLDRCVELKIFAAETMQAMDAIQIGIELEGEGQGQFQTADFGPSLPTATQAPTLDAQSVDEADPGDADSEEVEQ